MKVLLYRARSGSTCEMTLLAEIIRFQVGRLYAQCWKSVAVHSQNRLDVRVAFPRSANRFQVGRVTCPELEEFCCVRAGSGSSCVLPPLAVDSSLSVGRLFLQWWKSSASTASAASAASCASAACTAIKASAASTAVKGNAASAASAASTASTALCGPLCCRVPSWPFVRPV